MMLTNKHNTKRTRHPSWIVLLVVALTIFSSSSLFVVVDAICPSVQVANAKCTDGKYKNQQLTTSCSGTDSIAASGTIEVTESFSTDSTVTFVPCVMWWCHDEYALDGGNICNIIAKSDGTCDGSTGTYNIIDGTSFGVPEKASKYVTDSNRSMGVKIKAFVGDSCIDDDDDESSNAAFLGYGFASLLGVAGTTLYFMKRRRRPLITLGDDESDNGNHAFVEMKDQTVSTSATIEGSGVIV